MTTIYIDTVNKIVYTDSQGTVETKKDFIISKEKKAFHWKGGIVFGTGYLADLTNTFAHLTRGTQPKRFKGDSFIVYSRKDYAVCWKSNQKGKITKFLIFYSKVYKYRTFGSGCKIAAAALDANPSLQVQELYDIVSRLDDYTDNEVNTYRL